MQGLAPSDVSRVEDRLLWPDVIKVYAIIAVVVIHSCVPFVYHYASISHFNWWVCDFCYAMSRPAVPLFVMLSGMFLLGKNEALGVFFAKRVKKVLIPFVFWQIFYFIWQGYQDTHHISLKGMVPAIFDGPTCYHLWYPFMLVGLYLATPVLRVYVQNASDAQIKYFLACWFCFALLLPIWERFGTVREGIKPVLAIGYSGYFVLGYYLRNKKLGAVGARIALALIPLVVAFTALVTNKLTVLRGAPDEFFMQYLSPNVAILSICLYLLMKAGRYHELFEKVPQVEQLVKICGATSFGVYLVHPCVLANVYRICNISLSDPALIAVPCLVILTIIISVVIVKLLQSVPGLRALVPG